MPPSSPPPLWSWRDAALGLAIAGVWAGPACARGELVGSPGGEVYGHAWVQGWAASGWPAWPTGTDTVAGATSWPVIDPLPTWVAGGLARLVGPVAAWDAMVVAWIVLAAVGGGALARVASRGRAGVVGAVALPLAPIFLGSLTSGLTEDGAYGLLALTVAALWSGRLVRGGLLLGLTAWCGLYLAWMGAAAGVALGAWSIARGGPGRLPRLGRWALAGLLAGLLAAPAALPFSARLAGQGHRYGAPPEGDEPLWRLNPWRHADLASFVTPGKVDPGDALVREHPTYPGAVVTLAALAAGPSPAWLAVAGAAVVSLGDTVSIEGHPRFANPVAPLFHALPLADRFNHHARLWLLGDLVLVALAARGATRHPRLVAALVAAEVALASPARFPLPGTPAASPAIYAAITDLPPGPVVVDGAAGPGIPPQKVFYDQRAHGRRLLHDPNRPGPVRPVPGAVYVALGPAASRAEALLGPPDRRAPDGAAWWIPPGAP